ncbi:hypothetical protein LCGC14_0298410 [marine sediment metagenome]|uniref:Uncharacterized protein n=1 Tax=marine sediment metagenome TaxID=412755 RepID=A0A0F9WCP1_9ZZZZ
MITEGMLIGAALIAMAMVGAGVIIGFLIGVRVTARLAGRDEPILFDKPGMDIEDEDVDDLETT